MAAYIWFMALVFILFFLWSKIREHSAKLQFLGKRLDLIEKRIADLSRTSPEFRKEPDRSEEPAQSIPSPAPKPPVTEKPAAAIVVPKPEPVISARPVPFSQPFQPKPISLGLHDSCIHGAASDSKTESHAPATPTEADAHHLTSSTSSRESQKFDWESLVGVKLFSWIAGVALLLAVVFFLRYSINQGWLMPKVRLAIGLLLGIGPLALCELKAARKYPVTANAMDASAIAILFSTFYAAHVLWDLLGAVPAFMFMGLVTAVAVLLSLRRDSAFIALLGLWGGFATPALLSTGENRPLSLFTYLLLLNAGLAYVAAKKKWPLLRTLSLVFTVFYQWVWVIKFLTDSQLPTALGVFLVFPILTFAMTARSTKDERRDWASLYGQTSNIAALLPLLFTLYLAAVPAYGSRYGLLFGFLLLLDAGLSIIALARGPEELHWIGGLSTILVSAIWLWKSYTSDAWPTFLAFVVLFAFFYLLAPFVALRFHRKFSGPGRWAVYAAPLLLFAFPALVAIEPSCSNAGPLFAVLLLLMVAISGYAVFMEQGGLYLLATLFATLAQAIWAYRHLTPERLFPGLVLFGTFGLLAIGVPMAARSWKKGLRPEGVGEGLMLLGIALLFFLSAGPLASAAIWGMALLLLVLNAGLIWHAAKCKLPLLAMAGIALSWIVLGTLWASISMETMLLPALSVMAGFALLVLAGNTWLQTQAPAETFPAHGAFLGLAGHLFLAIVAANKGLSIPPWPFLCVLLVLDLAIGVSALHLRRTDLHQAAMTASALLLMIWAVTAETAPWPGVAILSAAGLSLISILWIYLAARTGTDPLPFSRTAALTIVLSQTVAILAATQPGVPAVGFLLAAHIFFVAALLGLAWFGRTHEYAVTAVFPAALAVTLWSFQHAGAEFWPQLLLFSAPIYLMFVAYPFLLGKRSGRALAPYLAAVLASVPFFFQARHALLEAGLKSSIGGLPVFQGLLMGLLVLRLLDIEPRAARSLGRLALVAGTALAFATVAIPLQLEKEWITIGWVLEAAALAWLYGKIPHKGLLFAATGLFSAVFVRLALNPFVLTYASRSGMRIWNWYLYTYLISSAAMIVGGLFLSKTQDSLFQGSIRISKLVPAGSAILLFLLLNIEIADYYSLGPYITFNFSATLAQDLTYTLGWALFGVVLLATGIMIHSQPARIASLALLIATIVKCFIHDLAKLGELYRVTSFVGLGMCLALAALALQKFIFASRRP